MRPFKAAMTRRIVPFLLFAALASACGRSQSAQRKDQNYQVVQEGQASGVTSTINAPGETTPPMTNTGVDTTTNLTLLDNPAPLGTQGTSNIAGTLPTTTTPAPAAAAPSVPRMTPTTTLPPMTSATPSAPMTTDTMPASQPKPRPRKTTPPPQTDTTATQAPPPPTDTTATQAPPPPPTDTTKTDTQPPTDTAKTDTTSSEKPPV
jgi:hypothetical protein